MKNVLYFPTRLLLSILIAGALALPSILAQADEADESLQEYWPVGTPDRTWNLYEWSKQNSSQPALRMSVRNENIGPGRVDFWFSDKPGQASETSNVERYFVCKHEGDRAWLFLESYLDAENGVIKKNHSVITTRVLYTPMNGPTSDLIADGTYSRCGGKGQPYLLWDFGGATRYRIQVWGVLEENPEWKWYWDATVSMNEEITNTCVSPMRTVRAVRVQEAWWSNFKDQDGKWNLGSGETAPDGLPTGYRIEYGRTVWHAQGRMPYYLIGRPDGKTVYWCVR